MVNEDAGTDGRVDGRSLHWIFVGADGRGGSRPYGEGESIGFRDAQLIKVSDRRELNFLLSPFMSRQVPSSMKVDAADFLRKALEGSMASSGYKVTLERLKVHSVEIEGEDAGCGCGWRYQREVVGGPDADLFPGFGAGM